MYPDYNYIYTYSYFQHIFSPIIKKGNSEYYFSRGAAQTAAKPCAKSAQCPFQGLMFLAVRAAPRNHFDSNVLYHAVASKWLSLFPQVATVMA